MKVNGKDDIPYIMEVAIPDMNWYNVVPPNVINWFINPMKTIVINTINHSYWSYLHQLSYRLGAPLCSH